MTLVTDKAQEVIQSNSDCLKAYHQKRN